MRLKLILIFAVAIGCCLVHAQDSSGGGDQESQQQGSGDQGNQQGGSDQQSGQQGGGGQGNQQGGQQSGQGGGDQGGGQSGQGGGDQQSGQQGGGQQGSGDQGSQQGGGNQGGQKNGGYQGGQQGGQQNGGDQGGSDEKQGDQQQPATSGGPPTTLQNCPSCACWWCYNVYKGWPTPTGSAVSAVTTHGAGWFAAGPGGASAVAVAGPGGAVAASSAGGGGLGAFFGSFFSDVSAGGEVKTKKQACQALIEQYSDKGPVQADMLIQFINKTFYATPKAQAKSAKGVTPSTFQCCHNEFGKEFFPKNAKKSAYKLPILPKGVSCENLVKELYDQVSGGNDKKAGDKKGKGKMEAKTKHEKKMNKSFINQYLLP